LGWAEGRNVQIERRFAAGDADRMQQYARELVLLKPDLIVAATSLPATLLRQETSTLPILFVFVSDPIGSGLAESMARPGGNMTGFTDIEDYLSFSVFRSGGRADFLWHRCTQSVAPSGSLRRPHPQRRKACRSSCSGSDEVRAGDQHENCEGTQHRPLCLPAPMS
jgi:hypothetical protein